MALSQGRSQYVQRHESVILYDYAAKDIRDTERELLGMLDERMKKCKRNCRRWRIPEAASGNWMQVLVSLVVDTGVLQVQRKFRFISCFDLRV